jgi:hypothetical protein
MIYFLAFLLIVAGFGLGWTAYPMMTNWILSLDCHCGSGRVYEDCCAYREES